MPSVASASNANHPGLASLRRSALCKHSGNPRVPVRVLIIIPKTIMQNRNTPKNRGDTKVAVFTNENNKTGRMTVAAMGNSISRDTFLRREEGGIVSPLWNANVIVINFDIRSSL